MPKILISELPKTDWWGKGMPHHAHNWLTDQQSIPRPDVVRDAYAHFVRALRSVADVTVLPFPKELDSDGLYKHDFVFVRDSYINVEKNNVVLGNFSERSRQDEVRFMKTFLLTQKKTLHTLSKDAYAEGGEFFILPQDKMLFAGLNRNNEKGVREVARLAGISDVCIVRTNAFHLDTNFCVLLDGNGNCSGVLACVLAISNINELKAYCTKHNIALIALDMVDGIGTKEMPGQFAVNSLAIPGILLSGARFMTHGVEEMISALGISHMITPLSDLNLSGGSVHCLTNEL